MEIRRGKWNRMNRGGEQRDQKEGIIILNKGTWIR